MHACNCVGKWGKGVATLFRDKYPAAHKEYEAPCSREEFEIAQAETKRLTVETEGEMEKASKESDEEKKKVIQGRRNAPIMKMKAKQDHLCGKAYLIEPQRDDYKKHWVGYLFTSWHYTDELRGRKEQITENGTSALEDMLKLISEAKAKDDKQEIGELHMSMINASVFEAAWYQQLEGMRNIVVEENMSNTRIYVHIHP